MDFAELKTKFNGFVADARQYFTQLSDHEKYAWIAEASGFCVFVAGVILL